MPEKCCEKCKEWDGPHIIPTVYGCYDLDCQCHKTPNLESWEERLKPKVVTWIQGNEPAKELALAILNRYWAELCPEIAKEIEQARTEAFKEFKEQYENNQKEMPNM